MIGRIIVGNFKNFRRLDFSLGRANLLIGENGSGKSNFLEVYRIVRALSWGLNVTEVLDGKPRDESFCGWDGIPSTIVSVASGTRCASRPHSESDSWRRECLGTKLRSNR